VYSKKTPDDGQRNCPKHVEFYFKNKFEKLVHLDGFIIIIIIIIIITTTTTNLPVYKWPISKKMLYTSTYMHY
jgi:hypothetical protein